METERKIEIDAKEAMIVYSLLDAGAGATGTVPVAFLDNSAA